MGEILVVGGIPDYNRLVIERLVSNPNVSELLSLNAVRYFGEMVEKRANYANAAQYVASAAKGDVSAAIMLDHLHVESSVLQFLLATRRSPSVQDIPIISISGDGLTHHARVFEHDGILIPGIYIAEKATPSFPMHMNDMALILKRHLSGNGDLYFVVDDHVRSDSAQSEYSSVSTLDDVVVGGRKLSEVPQGETIQVKVPGSAVIFQKKDGKLITKLSGLDDLSVTSYVQVHSFNDFECHLSEST